MLDLTAPDGRPQATITLEWEVVDLLLDDDRVVREMFEDIVTAEWPPTPQAPVPEPPGAEGGGTAGARKPGPVARNGGPACHRRQHRPGADGWGRERSPPNS